MNSRLRWIYLLFWAGAISFSLFLVVRLFLSIDAYAVNVPWWDNFDYYFLLAGHANWWQRFTVQLGPHREGLSLILSSIIAPLSHWNMRAEAFAVGAILTLAMLVFLWMKKRAFGNLTPADFIVIPAIFLSPRQSYHWCFVVNSAHGALPLLLLSMFCLGWTIKTPTKRNAFLVAVTFFSVFTGFAFFIGIIALVAFLCRRNWLPAALVSAVLLLFFLPYRFNPAVAGFQFFDPNIVFVLPYSLAVGLANITGFGQSPMNQIFGYPELLAALAVILFYFPTFAKGEIRATVIVSLVSFGLLFMLFALEGRVSLGRDCLVGSRYVPLISPVFLGVYLSIAQIPQARLRAACLGIAVCLAVYASTIASNGGSNSMSALRDAKLAWIHTYLATNDINSANRAARIPIYPSTSRADLPQKLQYLEAHKRSFYFEPPKAAKSNDR
jgi:hypothetical protein